MKPAVLSRMERYFHWAGTKDHKAKEYGLRLIAEVRRLEQLNQGTACGNGSEHRTARTDSGTDNADVTLTNCQ